LYINNVRQEPVSAYSTNGTAVSLTGSVVSSDDIYVIYLARAVQTTVPPDGSVSTAKIADSSVSTAKIADSSVSTAKIADGSVTTAKLQSGATFNPITNLQMFRINTNISSTTSNTTITAYTDAHDSSLFKRIGTAWSVSSGVFTPSVSGLYEIQLISTLHSTSEVRYIQFDYNYSTNSGGAYSIYTMYGNMPFLNGTTTYASINFPRYFNIVNASTFRFFISFMALNTSAVIRGQDSTNDTSILIFKRLADAQ